MVKEENADISMPDSLSKPRSEPDVPPGFEPKPSTSAAAESLKNQNPSCMENEFWRRVQDCSVHEQTLRRTSRKRSRPKLYEPPSPPQPPRRRGRSTNPGSVSHRSRDEIETRNSNEVSSTPLRMPQQQVSCFIEALHITKEKSSSKVDAQVNTSPSPNHHRPESESYLLTA